MPTPPPPITALPAPPDPNDRSTFNARAYPWSVAQQTLATEIGAVAANVKGNADDAVAAAGTAATAAGTAGAAASAAAASAASAINAPGTQATSVTSVALGTGTKVFTLQQTGKLFPLGGRVFFADPTAPTTRRAVGTVTANDPNAPTLTVNVTNAGDVTGSGTYSNWTIANAGEGTNLPATTVPDAGKLLGVTPSGVYGLLAPRLAGGAAAAASVTLTASSAAVQRVVPTTPGVSVTMPDGTTMAAGAAFMIANAGGYDVALRDSTSALLGFVRPAQTATVGIADISTAAGKWVMSGGSTHGVPASGEVAFALALGASGTCKLRNAVGLDATRDLLIFHGDARMYAVVWDSTAGAFGTPVLVRSATFLNGLNCIAIKSATDQVLVMSCDNTTAMQGVVLSVSGTSVTVGTAASVTLAGNYSLFMDLIQVVGQGWAVCYARSSTTNGVRAITISGTTAAIGAEVALSGNGSGGTAPPVLLDAGGGKIMAFSVVASTTLYAQPITQSGTTLTGGTQATLATNSNYYSVRALASGRWALVYPNSGVYGAIVSLSGTVATASSPVLLGSGATVPGAVWAKGSQVVVCGDATGTPFFANVLTDSAGAAVAGTAITRDGLAFTMLAGNDIDAAWVVNSPTNALNGTVRRIGISGNNPVVLSATPVSSLGQDVGGVPAPLSITGALNTAYGKNTIAAGLLQGALVTMPAQENGYALAVKFAAGVPIVETRPPGPGLAGSADTNQWCRVGVSAQWAGAQSSTTSVIVQKVQVA